MPTSYLRPVRLRRAVPSLLVLGLALVGAGACGTDAPEQATASDGPSPVDASSAPPTRQSLSETDVPHSARSTGTPDDEGPALTWYRDISPMVERHCGSCHVEGGQGTGDFTDPDTVSAFSPAMINSVHARRMPPPASDPECREYIGADRWVAPPDFTERLQAWVDDGAPLGSPEDHVPVPPIAMRLDNPDLEVRLPAPYRPTFSDPANPGNEYRCFVVEHGQDETFYIRGMAPVIDREDLVHHIVLFKARRDDVPAHDDWNAGYDCIDMTFFVGSGGVGDLLSGDSGMISAWAPGSQAVHFADDAGIRMDPDHVFIMQMHYFDGSAGNPQPDLSGYEFITADSARPNIIMAPFGPTGFRIPAGAENHTEAFSITMPLNLHLHGVMPHMHYLGQSYHMWFTERGNEQCVVSSDAYDFDNQLTYMFEEPIRIRAGSEIGFRCTWNNSPSNPNLVHDPPVEVRYGERTDEEMCFGFALISIN
ncbi:MAG: hypothetical protein EA398_17945 [Deltaproteobacteria bacterium]|nr:MAG: hypothetical protein EA398_17945 [Deltaproteobacteria bacterium]